VSADFQHELQNASRTTRDAPALDYLGGSLRKQFVLPDFQTITKGFVKADDAEEVQGEQVLQMETERFAVPDVLFRPSDVGMEQAGISEAAWFSLKKLPLVEQGLAAANIVLTGGNVKFPQLRERFVSELRPNVPDAFSMRCHVPAQPDEYAWRGAARWVDNEKRSGKMHRYVVSKADYLEYGHDYCNEKFARHW
jgi:actin-related protein 6